MRFFLAGIIQGSKHKGIHGQDYRARLKAAILESFPGVEVYCPMENHPDSVAYGPSDARQTFFDLMGRAGRADVVVAYLPEASMGTAIEMWEAKRAGGRVIAISPLTKNWVIRFLADASFASLEEFEAAAADGRLAAELENEPTQAPRG